MRIQKYPIKLFEDNKPVDVAGTDIVVPSTAKFLGVKALLQGVFAYYLIPTFDTGIVRTDAFMLAQKNIIDPDVWEIVDICDFIVERQVVSEGSEEGTETETVQIVYPVFKRK